MRIFRECGLSLREMHKCMRGSMRKRDMRAGGVRTRCEWEDAEA